MCVMNILIHRLKLAPDPVTDAATCGERNFDRDEKAEAPVENAQHRENRKPIDQAHRDVEAGIQDTERIGTPNDVPSSRRNGGR